jgi:hypothetical protein
MNFLQIADPTLHKLPSLLQLASHEGELAVVQVEPDEVCAFVGHEGIVIGSEFD